MTQDLFRQDAYLHRMQRHRDRRDRCWASCWTARCSTRWAAARPVTAGVLVLADGTTLAIADTRKGKDAEGKPTSRHRACACTGAGSLLAHSKPAHAVTARIDWERRHRS
jgi:misacylated tRNA(Ala) deacylase